MSSGRLLTHSYMGGSMADSQELVGGLVGIMEDPPQELGDGKTVYFFSMAQLIPEVDFMEDFRGSL